MATNNTPLDPWQNPLGTGLTTVPASKVSEAAEVIRGIAGSWAASYVLDPGLRDDNINTDNRYPNPQQLKVSKLGHPGHPEINFAPYAFRTNRFGNKGGSLIGHPISFEVVGPTLKSSGTTGNANDEYWFWTVVNNSGTTGDYLDLSNINGRTVNDLYATGSLSNHAGGLYVVISQTAQDGPFVGGGGIGDGAISLAVPGAAPLVPITEASKFEIFRVTAISGTRLTLDYTKRLSTYFTFPDDPNGSLRAIMIIRPKATRMVAIPEPGVSRGHEKTFAVVSPARALNTDEQYNYQVWVTNPIWTEYWLKEAGGSTFTMMQGRAYEYLYQPALPVPRPKGKAVFYLPSLNTATHASWMGLWETSTDAEVGDIIHIYDARRKGVAQLRTNGSGRGVGVNALLGWFEVMERDGGKTYVRRYGEVDPETGRTFAGSSTALLATSISATDRIQLHATVHSPVKSLWINSATGNYFDIDAVNSARLTNIIDPTWTERSAKGAKASAGFNPARADRAVFDTRGTGSAGGNADPGSLMDLGFRMVLFPAKAGTESDPAGGPAISITIPDWSRPITSNELILDPSVRDERQYVDIDYANGIVRFSHAPQVGSDVWPTSTGSDNPRGELVLFACCVPYSMEEGQLGSGFRATSSTAPADDCVPGLNQGSPDQADIYSRRVALAISESPAQVIGSARNGGLIASLTLQGWVADQIPLSGVVEILQGSTSAGDPIVTGTSGGAACRGSLYGYDGVEEALVGPTQVTYLYNVYGGGDAADTFTVDVNNPAVAVWRREFMTPQDAEGLVGVDYQYDTTYGSAKRSTAIRFEYSDLKANEDGTISVQSKDPVTASHRELFNDLYRSWLISGGTMGSETVFLDHIVVPIAEAVILKDGVRQLVPALSVNVNTLVVATHYIKYTGDGQTECVTCTKETTLPLDSPEDILLGMVDVTAFGVYTKTDLRNPLLDMNQRTDIYVGQPSRSWATYKPHFALMSDAIKFANEMGNPTSGVGVQQIRIFVVGPVDETYFPIVIKTDGIVIESAAKTDDTSGPEVCWAGKREPLFDLNGHSNIVFRNVSFRHIWTGLPPIAADADGAFVVLATGGSSSNVIIDNCRLVGMADGLVTTGTTGGVWTLSRWHITRNTAPTLLTSGVFSAIGFTQSVIADNLFWQDSLTDGWDVADILDGIVFASASFVTVERNDISRFRGGIVGICSFLHVHHNTLTLTRKSGVVLSGWTMDVIGNYLMDVYQDVPAGTVWRDGIYCLQTTSPSSTRVEGNYVMMPTDWAPAVGTKGAAIHLEGLNFVARGNRALRHDADQDDAPCLLVGGYSLIEADNTSWIVRGFGNRVTGCTMHRLDVNFDRFGWFGALYGVIDANNSVDGNTFIRTHTGSTAANGGVVLGGLTQVSNNYFGLGGPTSAAFGRGLYVCNGCSLVNNDILHLKDMVDWVAGPDMSEVSLTGNIIHHFGETASGVGDGILEDGILEGWYQRWVNNGLVSCDVTLTGSTVLFRGNRLVSDGVSVFTINGDNTILSENSFYAGKNALTVHVAGDKSRLAGNNFIDDGPSTLTVTGTGNILEGNMLTGNLTATPGDGGDVIIAGNRVYANGATGHIRVVFTSGTAPNAIITGNWASGDIQYYNGAASVVPPAGSHYVCHGNRATNVFTLNPTPTQYPAAANVDDYNID